MLNLNSLNPQQRQAVETLNGPVLILAGAGTGKTRVITFRIAHLIAKGVAPANILAVTFTNKAAREMQERVHKLLPKRSRKTEDSGLRTDDRPTICTFHSLCVRILRQHIERLGYKRNFVIYNESEQLGAVKKILAQISAKGEKTDPAAVLALLSRFKNGGERAAVFADESVRALAQHIRSRYETALHACNAVDFDDLILLTLRLFDKHPAVLEAFRAKYRYIMADEYQDTNATQFQLVHALTAKHRNFCVVGDDDQSIYGWRGAEIGNLLDLEKHFPEVKIIKLEQNYRSTNTILDAANAIIKNNVRRRPKQLWSGKGRGDKIVLRTYTNDDNEARNLVEQIEFARRAHGVPWLHHAVLFRTNVQSRPLETAFRTAGVRYHLIGGQSFFDRAEVRDFLAYLKVFINPHDDVSLLRIANVPARGLSDVTMERLLAASHERKGSVFAAMKNPAVQVTFQTKARESIEAFVAFIEKTRAQLGGRAGSPLPAAAGAHGVTRPTFSLQSWAEHFLDETGYFAELKRLEKNSENAEDRIRNLRELTATLDQGRAGSPLPAADGAHGLSRHSHATAEVTRPTCLADQLQSFLEDITLDSEREEEKEAGDAVTLITMHSCKGLEFPRVYIVGLEEGLLPHARSAAEGTLDEERRLFYVAVTRAMQSLTLSHCAGRMRYGQLMPCHPSRFLKELPPELVEDDAARDKKPVAPDTGKKMFDVLRSAIN
ncbi:MAG: UvrD-helicase domain-containing protein [Verrucomicrobiota bacterium]